MTHQLVVTTTHEIEEINNKAKNALVRAVGTRLNSRKHFDDVALSDQLSYAHYYIVVSMPINAIKSYYYCCFFFRRSFKDLIY